MHKQHFNNNIYLHYCWILWILWIEMHWSKRVKRLPNIYVRKYITLGSFSKLYHRTQTSWGTSSGGLLKWSISCFFPSCHLCREQLQRVQAVLSSVVFVILVVLVCSCFHADTYVHASPVKSSLHTAPSAFLQKPTLLMLDLSKKRRNNSLNVVCQKWLIRALHSLLLSDVNLVIRVYDSYVSLDVLVCTGAALSMIVPTW